MKTRNTSQKVIAVLLSLAMVLTSFNGLQFSSLKVLASTTISDECIVDGTRTYELTDENGNYIGVKYTITLDPYIEDRNKCIYGTHGIAQMVFYYEETVDTDTLNSAFRKHIETDKIWENWYTTQGWEISVYSISFEAAKGVNYIIPKNICKQWNYTGYYSKYWSLLYLNFDEGLTTIEEYAFGGCEKIISINESTEYLIFPESLIEIERDAFVNSLLYAEEIVFPYTDHQVVINYGNFKNIKNGRNIYFFNPDCIISTYSTIHDHTFNNTTFYGYSVEISKRIDSHNYVTPFLYSRENSIPFINLASTDNGTGDFFGETTIYVDEITDIQYSLHKDVPASILAHANIDALDSPYKHQELIKTDTIEWVLNDTDGTNIALIEDINELAFTTDSGTSYVDSSLLTIKGINAGTAVLNATIDGNIVDSCTIIVKDKPKDSGFTLDVFSAFDSIVDSLGTFSCMLASFKIQKLEERDLGNGNTLHVYSIGANNSMSDNIKQFLDSDSYLKLLVIWNEISGHPEKNLAVIDPIGSTQKVKALRDKISSQKKSLLSLKGSSDGIDLGASALFYSVVNESGDVIDGGGGALFEASGSTYTTIYIPTPFGPLYLDIELGADGEFTLPLTDFNEGEYTCKDEGNISVTPYIMPEFGYGIDGVNCIGVYGKLNLPLEAPLSNLNNVTLSMDGSLGIHLQAFFLFDYRLDVLNTPKLQLWPQYNVNYAAPIQQISDTLVINEPTYNLIDTNNLSDAVANWNTNNSDFMNIDETYKNNLLLDNVLSSSLPIQKEIDGKQVMIFQSYNPNNKNIINSCSLMYSVKDTNSDSWSTPKYIWDNGTSDYFADMKTVNDQLVLTWMKSNPNSNLTDKNNITDTAKSSEIYISIFDTKTNSFNKPIRVTNNTTIDMMPQIVNSDNKIAVSWVRNNSNCITQKEGTNFIYAAEYNQKTNTFETERKISKATGTIESFVSYYDNSKIRAIYTGVQNNIVAVYDTDGLSINSLSKLKKNILKEGTIANMQYIDGNIELISNGDVYQYNLANGITKKVNIDNSAIGSNVQYVSNGTTSAYVWNSYNPNTEKHEIVASIKTSKGYTKKITLFESKDDICRYMSPIIDENGNWSIVANFEKNDTTNKLVAISKKNTTTIKVNNITIDETTKNDSLQSPIWIDVENVGTTNVNKYYVCVEFNGKKQIKEITTNLETGDIHSCELYFDFGTNNTVTPITISVYSSEFDVQRFTYELGTTNISIDSYVTENVSDNTTTLTAVLKNNGDISCDVDIDLSSISENTQISTKLVHLSGNETKEITFTVYNDQIDYTKNRQAHYKIVATPSITETDYSDNTSLVTLHERTIVIDGFQINPSTGVRTIYSTNYSIEDVAEIGLIYGYSESNSISPEDMVLGSTSTNVLSFIGTELGNTYIPYTDLYNGRTYVMTMTFGASTVEAYTAEYAVRAYVKLSNGRCVYSDIETYSAYEIAKTLYETGKVSNKNNYDGIYSIVSTVDPSIEPIDYDWANTIYSISNNDKSNNIEVSGYSISTTAQSATGVFGGIRMCFSTKYSDDDINSIGLIMANTNMPNIEDMVMNSSNSDMYIFKSTSVGKSPACLSSWGYGQTYILTMMFEQYSKLLLTDSFSIRAFVELSDGTIEYSDISTFTIFNVTEHLYNNSLMSNEERHNFLYDNILLLVNPEYKATTFDWSSIITK